MTKIVLTSVVLFLGLLAGQVTAQVNDYLLLDEVSIEGEVREPAVAIISSRIQPVLRTFKLEKSFLAKLRRPDPRIVNLNPGIRLEQKIRDADPLLKRSRVKTGVVSAESKEASTNAEGEHESE